jgi:hypothetical protein
MDIDPASSPIIEMIANGGEVRFGQLSGRSINISAGGAPPHTANPFIDITQAAGTYRINGATVMGIAATETQLYHSGAAVISTQAAAAGGLIVDNQSTGAGFERVLTVSDIGVQASGTPVNNQLAIWVNATTVEGDADLTWDGAELAINAGIPIIDFSGTNGLAANSIRTRAANGGLEIELLHIDGSATIWQTDAAGTTQEDAWITFARNGAVALHFDGSVALETTASGIEIQDPNGLNIEQLVMAESGGTVHAIFTASAASVLLQAAAGSGQIAMQKSTNSVTIDTTDVTLVHLGTDVARTLAAASGGLEANNTLTGAGFERVLTTSDQGAAAVQHVEQTTDTTVNNSITLVNTQLTFTDVPTGFYRIDGMFLLRDVAVSGSGARIDCSITGADSDSVARLSNKNFSGAGALSFDEQGLATDLFDAIGLVTGSGTSRFMFIGYVEFISGTNTFTVQFAQNVATVGDLDFEAGSFLSLSPIS